MDPMTIAALTSAGGSIAGSLLNQGPETPDFVNPAIQAAKRRRKASERTMDRRADRLEGTIAATGMSGSGAAAQREGMYRANNDLQSRLDARLIDSIARARRQQEMAEYQAQQRKAGARAQAIGNLSNVAGMVAANQFGGGGGGIPDAMSYGEGEMGVFVDPQSSYGQNPIFATQGYTLG